MLSVYLLISGEAAITAKKKKNQKKPHTFLSEQIKG